MTPITGPFTEYVDKIGVPGVSTEKMWYRQRPPYNLPLFFRSRRWTQRYRQGGIDIPDYATSTQAGAFTSGSDPWSSPGDMRNLVDKSYAQAYDRFMGKAKNNAALAVSLAEGKQSISMVAQRGRQLLGAALALKRGDLRGLMRNLDLDGKPTTSQSRRAKARGTAGTWLEYTFGWKPLIQDIGDAVDVLQQDFDPIPVRGRGMGVLEKETKQNSYSSQRNFLTAKSEVRGTIKVTNPDLFLANQLGFINPATVAWELVPFSFVVDWFIPVGKFVSSLTNTVGMEIIDSSYTITRNASCIYTETYDSPNDRYNKLIVSTGKAIDRRVGEFPTPSLRSRMRLPTADAWLAATSISLLVQQLRSFR